MKDAEIFHSRLDLLTAEFFGVGDIEAVGIGVQSVATLRHNVRHCTQHTGDGLYSSALLAVADTVFVLTALFLELGLSDLKFGFVGGFLNFYS